MNSDIAYLVGACMGDGHLSIRPGGSYCYQFILSSSDEDFCERCLSICKKEFGTNGNIRKLKNHYHLVVCSKDLVYYLERVTKYKTTIPNFIYEDIDFKKAFIQGVMDSDGWIFKPKASDGYTRYRVGFCNTAEWTKGVYDILQSLLVKTGKLRKRSNYRYDVRNQDIYSIAINSRSYCEKVGFRIDRKNKLAQDCLQFYKNKEIKNGRNKQKNI